MAEWWDRARNWLAGVLTVAGLGVAIALAVPLVQRPSPPPVRLVATPPASPTPLAEVQVHVTGAVLQPGLYALPAGSRVGDAVQAAGLAEDADPDALNLAARLTDGQRLVVPRQGEPLPAPTAPSAPRASAGAGRAASAAPAPRPDRPLNLNTATAEQLDALPGIGPAYAQRILDYRARNGPFQSVQQLRDARLLPNATFERIKDLVVAE
jgi:competence protein ComEA